jgi:hypothetical protein
MLIFKFYSKNDNFKNCLKIFEEVSGKFNEQKIKGHEERSFSDLE